MSAKEPAADAPAAEPPVIVAPPAPADAPASTKAPPAAEPPVIAAPPAPADAPAPPKPGPSVEDQIAAALAKAERDHAAALEAARLEGAAVAKAEAEEEARRAALTEQARLEEDLRIQSEAAAASKAELASAVAKAQASSAQLEFVRALSATPFSIVSGSDGKPDPDIEALALARVQAQVDAGSTWAIALDDVRTAHPGLFAAERSAGSTSTGRAGTPGTGVPAPSPVSPAGVGNVFDLTQAEWRAKQLAIGAA
jgi:hypothetical protein